MVYVKGAPKELLALSRSVAMDEGEVPSTEKLRAEIMAVNDEYACSGLRVLAIAYRPWCFDGDLLHSREGRARHDFSGLMAMMDPPRPEVSAVVQRCHEAGIRIIMITVIMVLPRSASLAVSVLHSTLPPHCYWG